MGCIFLKLFRTHPKEPLKKINRTNINRKIQFVAAIVTILGVSLISILGPLKDSIPIVQRKGFEKLAEQIKVSRSKEYIDYILGVPVSTETIKYNNGFEIGKRSLHNNKYFLLITYYRADDTLLGYFLISKTERFATKMFRDTPVFQSTFEKGPEITGGYLAANSYFRGLRRDTSDHYIEYYFHHLATNGCFVGFGITDLVYYKDNYSKFLLGYPEESGVIEVTNVNRNDLLEKREPIKKMKPNVFSIFIDDEINILELLSNELDSRLVLTHIEYDRLSE